MTTRRPTWAETVLLVVLTVVVTTAVCHGTFDSREALASSSGTNNIIAVAGQGDKADLFYVVDTAKRKICLYRWSNPGLRLIAARCYDFDAEIMDSAGDKMIEGRGATRGYVKSEVEAQRRRNLGPR
jgi:hypothetical protein